MCWMLEPWKLNAMYTGQLVYRSKYTSMSSRVLTSLGFYIAAHRARCFA